MAIFKRDFSRFFFNPAGYLFIALFVLVCAAAAFWRPTGCPVRWLST